MSRAVDPDRLTAAVVGQAGWNVSRSKAGLLRFHPPSGAPPIVAPAQLRDRSGWAEVVAQLRAKGMTPGALAGIWTQGRKAADPFEKLTVDEREVDRKQLAADLAEMLTAEPVTPGSLMAQARLTGQRVLLKEVQVALDAMVTDGLAVAVGDTYLAPPLHHPEPEPQPRWRPPEPPLHRLRRPRHLHLVGPRQVWCSPKHGIWHATAHNRPQGDERSLCGYLLVPGAAAELCVPTCADCLPEIDRFI